jgi:hypothetical protein
MQVLLAAVRGVLALGIAVLFIDGAVAQVPVEEGSGVITMTGTVEDIEVPERLLTVVGPDGTTIVGIISPDVKDIKTIKLKDKVTIDYSQEIAVALRNPEGPAAAAQDGMEAEETSGMDMNAPTVAEQDWVETTPSGAESDLTTVEVTDTIAAIDKKQRTVTFAGTDGKTRTIYVPPTVTGFDNLQVGDTVVIEVTRASIAHVQIT